MKVYLFDKDTRLYMGEAEAVPGDVPGSWFHPECSTVVAPPAIPPGKAVRWLFGFWEYVGLPTPEEMRQHAYESEADPFRDAALNYQMEAAAWRLEGNLEKAAEAETKEHTALRDYLDKKQEIRGRFPGNSNVGEA